MRPLTFAALTLLLAASVRAATVLIVGPPTAKVKTVVTPDDLLKTEVITFDNSEIHLGIEANTVPLGSGVMVYAWWNGKGPSRQRVIYSNSEVYLGPVRVSVVPQKSKNADTFAGGSYVALPASENIFAGFVAPPKAGVYDLKFYSIAGDLLAQTTLDVVDKASSPFATLAVIPNPAKKRAADIDPYVPSLPAIPVINPSTIASNNDDLPKVSALTVDDSITLSVNGGELKIESKNPFAGNIEQQMLARFFVNGKPVTFKPNATEVKQLLRVARTGQAVKKQTINLSINPAIYSAKEGDTVEVQILLTPNGYRPLEAGGSYADRRSYFNVTNGFTLPRLSPKIAFIGPKVPAVTKPAPAAEAAK